MNKTIGHGWQCLTCLLILRDAHDPEGIHGLAVNIFVLLSCNSHFPIGQEAIFPKILQAQLRLRGKKSAKKKKNKIIIIFGGSLLGNKD